ncbi:MULTISPECIES: YrbL family protein [Vibrio]|uniref:PhoP regulatory network protein YrbL n=2 Tax=Vibrio TaxID=662 RepID=A0A7X4LPH1_9VIBR|nr:YrbL family protein [Vibrio nitrifigilis]MBF9001136.1 hypothetical protein [Vibrio nitrifigilis]MZI95744.1 hypothetical protein [Vibrio eleionomae]
MIDLSKAKLIGQGSERQCFQHPEKPDRCIKIRYNKKRRVDESIREYRYAKKYLIGKELPVALPLSWVETSKGPGLECELVLDKNGEIADTLLATLNKENSVDLNKLKEAAWAFRDKLLSIPVSVTDMRLQNICIRENRSGGYELILIDGIGFANFIKVGKLFPSYTYRQTAERIDRAFKHILFAQNA